MRTIFLVIFWILTFFFLIGFTLLLKKLNMEYKCYKFYQREIVRLRAENNNLKEKIENFGKDSFYIEKILREEYGMIKPGEIIIKTEE